RETKLGKIPQTRPVTLRLPMLSTSLCRRSALLETQRSSVTLIAAAIDAAFLARTLIQPPKRDRRGCFLNQCPLCFELRVFLITSRTRGMALLKSPQHL